MNLKQNLKQFKRANVSDFILVLLLLVMIFGYFYIDIIEYNKYEKLYNKYNENNVSSIKKEKLFYKLNIKTTECDFGNRVCLVILRNNEKFFIDDLLSKLHPYEYYRYNDKVLVFENGNYIKSHKIIY